MATEIRNTALGAIDDGSLLRDEINSEALVAAVCSAVVIYRDYDPGVSDRVVMTFDVAPDTDALDASLAAYPAYQHTVPATVALAAATWQTIFQHAMSSHGETLCFDIVTNIQTGTAAAVEGGHVVLEGSARRRTGEGVSGVLFSVYSDIGIAGFDIQLVAEGNAVSVQIQTTNAITVSILDPKIRSQAHAVT